MPFDKDFLILCVEAHFLLKPDAPKTNAFHVKDVVNIDFFVWHNAPKWMPL